MLEQAPKATGTRGQLKGSRKGSSGGSDPEPPDETVATLADLGIDKKTSALSQRLAALSDSDRKAVASREKTLAEVSREITAAARAVRLELPDAKQKDARRFAPVDVFRLTAETQGNGGAISAMSTLGLWYTQGRGVAQDYVQAHMWYNLAASRSTRSRDLARENAVKSRDTIALDLTPAQLAEAQRLAPVWIAAHPREP